jgi:hypothetical protein
MMMSTHTKLGYRVKRYAIIQLEGGVSEMERRRRSRRRVGRRGGVTMFPSAIVLGNGDLGFS